MAGLLEGKRQAWVVNDWQGLVLTDVTRLAVRITHGAGRNRNEWIDEFHAHIREWAKHLGKKRIISLARVGWSKDAKARGFRETHREFVMEL